MVERLKDAINKARERRETGAAAPPPPQVPPSDAERGPGDELRDAMLAAVSKAPATSSTALQKQSALAEDWAALTELTLNTARLDLHRIVSYRKSHPAHVGFDMLRTRILNVLRTNGWTRLAITSATKGCGKTMVSLNLALSLGHQADMRSMFFDMDLRSPSAAKYLDVHERFSMESFLNGVVEAPAFLRRAGTNLALGLNTAVVPSPAEMLHHARTKDILSATLNRYRPNVAIFDLPPVLVSDDVLAFLPHGDCVLMGAASGQTTPKEIREAEQVLGNQTNFLGVMLNKSKEKTGHGYYYS
jgi:protein-tyrosine kinase